MQHRDVAIVGGGLAGSLAAAMLGRAGYDAILIDPHRVYPQDFRCEKLDDTQVGILEKTGLAETVRQASTPCRELWMGRHGRVYQIRPGEQFGIMYETLVNTMRGAVPQAVTFAEAKVTAVSLGEDQQHVTLSTGETISARLVLMANGLNLGLRHKLGMTREMISAGHSISVGFDIKPVGRPAFGFPAMTYFSERPSERMAYLTLFPIGNAMRANLFGYRDINDPWMQEVRNSPREALRGLMPGLQSLVGDFEVTSFVKIRPADLYVTNNCRQPGIVLVGDAYSTSCPAAGTGARKVLMDVERLCNVYIPQWLASRGMGIEKIGAFYNDPEKRACDGYSLAKAYSLRSFCIDGSLRWRIERWARFAAYRGLGALHQARRRRSPVSTNPPGAAAPAA